MTTTPNTLTETARQLLAQGDAAAASACLNAALELAPAHLGAHNLREQHRLPGNFSEWTGVNGVIAPDDDIFAFFAGHPTSINPVRDYLADGWRTFHELALALDKVDKSVFRVQSLLEFACGHGRFTRHLARVLPPAAVTASDVVPGSVDFVCHHFGVRGFYSTPEPESLPPSGTHEVVFVLSLFSHLPQATWQRWLRVLYDRVAPGGALVVSTHGEKCARLSGVSLADDPFVFFPSSESNALEGAAYGTTFTRRDWVEATAMAVAPRARIHIEPEVFWGNQDALIICRPQ